MDKFDITSTPGFAHELYSAQATLLVSTYQAGRVFIVSSLDGNTLDIMPVRFRKPMGISIRDNKLAIATLNRIEIYAKNDIIGKNAPFSFQKYDDFYVPRISYISGALDLHDIHLHSKGVFAINTQFNCISSFSVDHNFTPRWAPTFIDSIVPEDRCHLNGMAVENDQPKYVTALGKGNVLNSWREGITDKGIIIDVSKNKIVAEDLAMPHSPRIYNGDVYFLQSASGIISRLNTTKGIIENVGETEAFSRGLTKFNNILAIGRSKARESSSTFKKLPTHIRNKQAGIDLVDFNTGQIIERFHFGSIVDEIFDVQVLIGGRIGMYGLEGEHGYEPITTPQSSFWRKLNDENILPK
ncbi:MAG: TIGR03032 family protein [Schleiferiaceae bacterium]